MNNLLSKQPLCPPGKRQEAIDGSSGITPTDFSDRRAQRRVEGIGRAASEERRISPQSAARLSRTLVTTR